MTIPPEELVEVEPGVYSFASGLLPIVDPSALALNVNAADTVNADQLRTGRGLGLTLDGTGVTVGEWDVGQVRPSHTEFANGNRITAVDTTADLEEHSTHVAGTIGARGSNAAARGMATSAIIRSRDLVDDQTELANDAAILDLANHSYGYLRGWTQRQTWMINGTPVQPSTWVADRTAFAVEDPLFGKYTSLQAAQDTAIGIDILRPANVDKVLTENPNLLAIWAAGNDRLDAYQPFTIRFGTTSITGYVAYWGPTNSFQFLDASVFPPPAGADGNSGSGYDSLPQTQVGKNALVIGAVDDVLPDPYTAANITMTPYSSWGPTDDGRIKPDLVANGQSVFSSEDASDTDYGVQSGTSMAAPNVTGTAALLLQHYRNLNGGQDPPSATLKGLLIHTATDAGNVGPDYQFGWGLVNAAAPANFLSDTVVMTAPSTNRIVEGTYTGDEWTISAVSDGTTPIKLTLVWTDPAPTTLPGAGLDDPTSVLVHDLDLWVTKSGTTYRPWTLDPANPAAAAVRTVRNDRDNVEQVLIDAPTAGFYTIRIGRDPNQGAFEQDFSLVASGAQVTNAIGIAAGRRSGVREFLAA